jgi:uroporphyrinogen-III synthase
MKRILYLGTDPKEFVCEGEITHYPVIQIVPRSVKEFLSAYAGLNKYTHIIFTSKNGVNVFFTHLEQLNETFSIQQVIAVGSVTASLLIKKGVKNIKIPAEETQEGIIALLKTLDLNNAHLFIPTSSLSRPLLCEFLTQNHVTYTTCSIYDTIPCSKDPKPNWEDYDQIVFTSPSTVNAFIAIFGHLPQRSLAIGPVTQQAIDRLQKM